MKKNKGTIHYSEIWKKKPEWLAEVMFENHPNKDFTTIEEIHSRVMNMKAGDITALLDAIGIKYTVDWSDKPL